MKIAVYYRERRVKKYHIGRLEISNQDEVDIQFILDNGFVGTPDYFERLIGIPAHLIVYIEEVKKRK